MVVGLSRQDCPIHYNLYRVNRLGNNPLAWVHTPHSKLPIATANATSMHDDGVGVRHGSK